MTALLGFVSLRVWAHLDSLRAAGVAVEEHVVFMHAGGVFVPNVATVIALAAGLPGAGGEIHALFRR